MKVKKLFKDFIVDEIPLNKEFSKKGKYKIFLLEKEGVESLELFSQLSKYNKISLGDLGYAGIKDKYAQTSQYVSVPSDKDLRSNVKNVKIKLCGYADEPIKRGDLLGNKFRITVRGIHESDIPRIKSREKEMKYGVVNYFDSQRFGSVIDNQFIAKAVVLGDYEEAVRIYLTESSKFEENHIKRTKKKIASFWPDLCDIKVDNQRLQSVIDGYTKKNDWRDAYLKISQNLREMYLYAYQSHLWNEGVKHLIRNNVKKDKLYSTPYSIGQLTFFNELSDAEKSNLDRVFTSIYPEIESDRYEYKIYMKLLHHEGVKLEQLDIKSQTRTFLNKQERPILIYPKEFKINNIELDEFSKYSDLFKVEFSFSLDKGSYATMIIKKLFEK